MEDLPGRGRGRGLSWEGPVGSCSVSQAQMPMGWDGDTRECGGQVGTVTKAEPSPSKGVSH